MTLVDTSVWVDHLSRGDVVLASLLRDEEALCHPFVIGELACGGLKNRRMILDLLDTLPRAEVVDHHEVLRFVEAQDLWGSGVGWIDAHLLASALLSRAELWTRDRALRAAATRLQVARREI
jgi:predicted nucleic acid-binding protein